MTRMLYVLECARHAATPNAKVHRAGATVLGSPTNMCAPAPVQPLVRPRAGNKHTFEYPASYSPSRRHSGPAGHDHERRISRVVSM